eukprot:CAMPEP_0175143968 /NCGR_PEP_ID=MMETSP0087-20121206/13817_1 /TAXON_ID=136419 /ORGANISM="Unknown Unknown, Strain D1" /LENGTH=488 /DNA_ID=CAMNT_0016428277 /DNA_START=24 /DNA_END=1487 /DNA_ORIENTATION=-
MSFTRAIDEFVEIFKPLFDPQHTYYKLQKQFVPFAMLLLTLCFVRCIFVWHYRRSWKKQKKRAKYGFSTKGKGGIEHVRWWVFCVLAVLLAIVWQQHTSGEIVRFIPDTDGTVAAQKQHNKGKCQEALNQDKLAAAEQYIRDRPEVMRKQHQAHLKHISPVKQVLAKFGNNKIIVFGCMFSVLPFLLVMGFDVFVLGVGRCVCGCFNKKFWKLPLRFYDVSLPVVNIVTFVACAVWLLFHLVVDSFKANACLHTSGHWYTETFTLLCSLLVWLHLFDKGEGWWMSYGVWFLINAAATWETLSHTQKFYHTADEAVDGLRYAVFASPVLYFLGGVIAYRQCLPPAVDPEQAGKEAGKKAQLKIGDRVRHIDTGLEGLVTGVTRNAYDVLYDDDTQGSSVPRSSLQILPPAPPPYSPPPPRRKEQDPVVPPPPPPRKEQKQDPVIPPPPPRKEQKQDPVVPSPPPPRKEQKQDPVVPPPRKEQKQDPVVP